MAVIVAPPAAGDPANSGGMEEEEEIVSAVLAAGYIATTSSPEMRSLFNRGSVYTYLFTYHITRKIPIFAYLQIWPSRDFANLGLPL